MKDLEFQDTVDAGVKIVSDFGGSDSMPHFIFCMSWFMDANIGEQLYKIIFEKMEKYEIQSSYLTMLDIKRRHLITKEKTKQLYEGKGWKECVFE